MHPTIMPSPLTLKATYLWLLYCYDVVWEWKRNGKVESSPWQPSNFNVTQLGIGTRLQRTLLFLPEPYFLIFLAEMFY